MFCRNVLFKAKELGLQTIGLCTISVSQRNFPSDLGAHIALSKANQRSPLATFTQQFYLFRDDSKVSRKQQPWNRRSVLGAARKWDLWGVSAALLSAQSTRRDERFVAAAEKHFRNNRRTLHFWSSNSHHPKSAAHHHDAWKWVSSFCSCWKWCKRGVVKSRSEIRAMLTTSWDELLVTDVWLIKFMFLSARQILGTYALRKHPIARFYEREI